jgi:hypothetical protein
MFVPLDRLYAFLDQLTDDDTVIYRFHPHGSRKFSDISKLYNYNDTWDRALMRVPLLMHDQEPLNYDLYQSISKEDVVDLLQVQSQRQLELWKECGLLDYMIQELRSSNLDIFYIWVAADRWMLCHSEKNSAELLRYESNSAIGIYWWSHALISRDWYRFAQVDQKLFYKDCRFDKDFNVYNRAWSGTREYRLKFSEMILLEGLVENTALKFSFNDNGVYYQNHVYQNPVFNINTDLSMLTANSVDSTASADYDHQDYQSSAIDIVLETLFDDQRIHLTEKTLRPIACGKPFILASTPGSLAYIRDYGFETFHGLIDESYDLIQDPLLRLEAIVKLMKDISTLQTKQKIELYKNLHEIAERNKKWFWSDDFAHQIVQEFKTNYEKAYDIAKQSLRGQRWLDLRKRLCKISDRFRIEMSKGNAHRSRQDIVKMLSRLRKNGYLTTNPVQDSSRS